MIDKLRHAWVWFVEGLVEALLWLAARVSPPRTLKIVVTGAEAAVLAPDGSRIGRLAGREGAFALEPPGIERRFAGSIVDIVVPRGWLFRRDLDPVAVQSRPFLDAFVRHQIERITPWRVGDVHFAILQHPLPDDASRIAVALLVIPKRLVAPWLAPIQTLGPTSLRVQAADGPASEEAILIGGRGSSLATPARRWIGRGLVVGCLAVLALIGGLQWQVGAVRADIDEQERVLAARKAVLARTLHRDGAAGDAAAKVRQLRLTRPTAVAMIDALAAALPDSAHLTTLTIEGDRVTVSGISTEPSDLVPALESSGRFADVAFGAATTRAENGAGDHFSLEMKARVLVGASTAQAVP